MKITERLRPGVVAIPFGWWSRHHPDGKVANSLTNDTLTEWGGGVAYSDTLVQVEAPPEVLHLGSDPGCNAGSAGAVGNLRPWPAT